MGMRAVLVSTLVLCGVLSGAGEDAALKGFHERLDQYVKLRKQATDKVPPLKKKAAPEEIEQHELALAQAIQKARLEAKAGDILTADVKPVFSRILRGSLTGPGSVKRRDSVKEGNPKNEKAAGEVEPVIKVNAPYPKNAPLSTVPPSLLAALPKLPKDVEYRFVGRTLILRDRESSLIVDFLKEAIPAT
jgi:hypothetical protein